MGFDEDLKQGERAEFAILRTLKRQHPELKKIKGYEKGFDLSDGVYSVEVKYDKESVKTGNIAMEILYKTFPSGISSTRAIDWVHIYYYKGWGYSIANVSELKRFIKANIAYFRIVVGGDNMDSKIVLLPCQIVANNFGFYLI